ncbi:MAG: hypothetical protein HY671_04520 [Chloroflexi bacterium]|nr:hypothetical protein [Chloroflexota bacterium]
MPTRKRPQQRRERGRTGAVITPVTSPQQRLTTASSTSAGTSIPQRPKAAPERVNFLRRLIKLFKPSDLKKPTVIILIIANLLPIYGVLFLGWEVFPLLLLFWTENIMIGVFNILKIAICSPASPVKWIAKIFVIPFFTFHYAVFMLVHGILINT